MKKIKYLIFILLSLFISTNIVNAGAVIMVNKSSVTVGESFTMSVVLSDVASWKVSVVSTGPVSNCTIAQADTSEDAMNTSKTYKTTCTATGTGTITLSFANSNCTDENGHKEILNGSKSVIVNPATTTTTTTKTTTTTTTTTKKTTKPAQIITMTEPITEPVTEPVTEPIIEVEKPKALLKSFKVVGFNSKFDANNNQIEVTVNSDINEIYIIVSKDEGINVTNDGLVDITNKDSFDIILDGEDYEKNLYNVKINRIDNKTSNSLINIVLLTISLIVSIVIIVVLLFKGNYFSFKK